MRKTSQIFPILPTLIALATLATLAVQGQATAKSYRFHSDGTYKIAQFTDTHFDSAKAASQKSIQLFDEVLRVEKPDLVIFSGDIVVENITPDNNSWSKVLKPFQEAGVDVAIALGNHDDEYNISRTELYEMLMAERGCIINPADTAITIKGRSGEDAALIYLFDSNAYSTNESVDGYGWITHNQVARYIERSRGYSASNGGDPLPALAYFHIPLPEYREAYNNPQTPKIGWRGEAECSPKINTGLFAAMVECGDVMGCFVGHDHVNDYISYLNNIALCYGRVSSQGTTYGDLTPGARVVILHEGTRRFDSYIYELGGERVQHSSYPRRLRFAVTADTHFDMPPESDQWRNVVELNRHNLDGVAIAGDVFDHQHPDILELFKRRYEMSGIDGDSTLHSQLYIGLGNHDINPDSDDAKLNIEQRTITVNYVDSLLRAMRDQGKITNLHPPTRNYSFDLCGLHFIQSHTWAGETTLGEGGLEWLAKDLKRYGSKGEPIVLIMHYTFVESERWINNAERELLYEVLKGYNIQAIFNGHDHYSKQSKWHGIPVYQADNTWQDNDKIEPSFWILEYSTEDGLSVERQSWLK